MADARIVIGLIDPGSGRAHYGAAVDALAPDQTVDITAQDPERAARCDLCVTAGETSPDQVLPLHAARRAGVPSLLVMDGILEWRNTWEHPGLVAPLLQPVISDKVACLGPSQARVLDSWGNAGRCEVTGCARFDPLLSLRGRPLPPDGDVLVMSARHPWFTDVQRERVLEGFRDLRDWFARRRAADTGTPRLRWRVGDDVALALGLAAAERDLPDTPLPAALLRARAVVTTPSTVMLEAMLLSRPVALLDFTGSPAYVPAAWSVHGTAELDLLIPSLLAPAAERMQWQETLLADALACDGPAVPRVAGLMAEMIRIGRACRAAGTPLALPARLREPSVVSPPDPATGSGSMSARNAALLENEVRYWRARAATQPAHEERLRRIERYGCGSLLARLVHTMPYPRRMLAAVRYWREDRRGSPGSGP